MNVVGEWLATRPESVRTRDKKGGEMRKRPKSRETGGKSRTLRSIRMRWKKGVQKSLPWWSPGLSDHGWPVEGNFFEDRDGRA